MSEADHSAVDLAGLKILTITNWYPPHHFGGYELSCYDVMRRLIGHGHQVEVLCHRERLSGVSDADDEHERHVHRELRGWVVEGRLVKPSLRGELELERHNQRALEAVLAEFEPDVVSAWQIGGLSLGLLTTVIERQIPIVYAVCDNWFGYAAIIDRWASHFNRRRWRRALGRAVRPVVGVPTIVPPLAPTGAFCFVSELVRRRSEERSRSHAFPISTVVYSGIERSLFPSLNTPPERPWRGRLLYVGRLDPRKGTETLIRALVELPTGISLALYGRDSGGERAHLEALAADLGVADRITFGELARAELAAHYADADMLVFPSEWEEPFGLVPIEAMACGTPVLATRVGGSAEFLRDRHNCVTFTAGDPVALAAAVRELASDPALRREIVSHGLELADELTTDRLAHVFEAWHVAAAGGFEGDLPRARRLP